MTDPVKSLILSSLKFGDFKLTSGQKANFYFDLETVLCKTTSLDLVTYALDTKIRSLVFTSGPSANIVLAGPALGAIPLLAGLAVKRGYYYTFYVSKDGSVRHPNLVRPSGCPVVLVDDVFSVGTSLYRTIAACWANGYTNIQAAVVLVNRSKKASEFFSKLVPLTSLYWADDLVREFDQEREARANIYKV